MYRIKLFLPLVLLLLAACSILPSEKVTLPPGTPTNQPALPPIESATLASLADQRLYLQDLGLDASEAEFFQLIDKALPLSPAEIDKLSTNGFVVSDRHTWQRFHEAYAWIYWQDLPVLITSDSILHTVHQSYLNLLKRLEYEILIPEMRTFLQQAAAAVLTAARVNGNKNLDPLYEDVETYFAVALALLEGNGGSGDAADYVRLAKGARSYSKVQLFGSDYPVDFTLFKPRGHYAETETLQNYFRAMNWLAQIDFRFVEYDQETSEPTVNPKAIAAAMILQDAVDEAGQRQRWHSINGILEMLVGRSDNMTLTHLDHFRADMDFSGPTDALDVDPTATLDQLAKADYGQQRITGQIIMRHTANDSADAIPRPLSFMLMGQRFALDSFVLGNVVYDRMMKDGGPIERSLPSPLDLAYAFGNDRAITHLQKELQQYEYADYLSAQRAYVDDLPPEFWDAPMYNQWLDMIRSLNAATADKGYPQVMRTEAWADKTLQTQLASWAQLRHDNILYVKQSMTTAQVVCEFPAAYVEPYPDLYLNLYDFAAAGHQALSQITLSRGTDTQMHILAYFSNVMEIAQGLHSISEKQLAGEPLNDEESLFLASVVKKKEDLEVMGCAGPEFEDMWDGWYGRLIYGKDENPALIADIHTNPQIDEGSAMYPPTVLHAATGYPVPIIMIVETVNGPTLFVGPGYSYYEVVTEGTMEEPPQRFDDTEWRQRLQKFNPPAPAWTSNFLATSGASPTVLNLPAWEELQQAVK